MKLKQPYLSIIVASRNDDHGKDMDKRQRIFVRGLIHQCNKFKLPAELIFVEWNPPADRPYLQEILPKPLPEDYLSLRYIVVPNDIHQRYRFASSLPLYQMIAKNVGIRRAKADFILCTNVDLLFSDKLMDILSKQNLNPSCFYRTTRSDIPETVSEEQSVEAQLSFAEKNVIRRLGKDPRHLYLHRYPSWAYGFKTVTRLVNYLMGKIQQLRIDPVHFLAMNLDTHACGDFTLMHKNAWLDIQGYPELDLYSIHIDSMGILAVAALGYKQKIFPIEACTYHIDHYNGWESLSPVEKISFINQRPGIGWDIVADAGKSIIRDKTKYNFNKPDWGFANYDFQEFTFNTFE